MSTESRVRHPRKYEDLFNLLIDKNIFSSKAQIILLAAAIGYNEGEKTSFSDKESLEPIRIATFDNMGRIFPTILNTIAIAETGDTKILSSDRFDDRIRIFEEYACTGLAILQRVASDPNEILDNLLHLIKNQLNGQEEQQNILEMLT